MKTFTIFILILSALTFHLTAAIEVLENPKPNMVEPAGCVELVKVREMKADIMDEEFIYKPLSLTVHDHAIFVYDEIQARIFKLDDQLKIVKSFGHIGQGPGEIAMKRMPVLLAMGLDQNLYFNDVTGRKIVAVTRSLEYLDQYRYNPKFSYLGNPAVGEDGAAYLLKLDGKQMTVTDQKSRELHRFTLADEDLCSLFYKISNRFEPGENRDHAVFPGPVIMVLMRDPAIMYTIDKNKHIKKTKLWPRLALSEYKPNLKATIDLNKHAFVALFTWILRDNDDGNVFYLDPARDETKGRVYFYKFNLDGKLLKVLYIKRKGRYPRLLAKENGLFYGITGENIVIYKEKEERK